MHMHKYKKKISNKNFIILSKSRTYNSEMINKYTQYVVVVFFKQSNIHEDKQQCKDINRTVTFNFMQMQYRRTDEIIRQKIYDAREVFCKVC